VLQILRRLSLGVLLIILASAVLLLADWSNRTHGTASGSPADARPRGPWRISFIQFNNVLDVEESERGARDAFRDAGLVEGRDIVITVRNANGDMPTVSSMVDAAVTAHADLLLTFSSPTLQAAIQRAHDTPIVFTYVANAFAAGAGRSNVDHLPNVTGLYMPGAYEEMIDLVRTYLPNARRFGTVYVPSEVNTVFHRDSMLRATAARGVELKVMAANSSTEVADAAMALAISGVDAICQLPGNLTASAFPAIRQAARQARVPLFAFQGAPVYDGALAGVVRDYYDGGREAAGLAVRILRGESPKSIPLIEFKKTRLLVNLQTARELGITTPPSVLAAASEVVK
jgi:ABC-type uncharacterized transport system substrate-binding protein